MQVAILHGCRHPSVVLMLGAWLGQDQLYMVVELLSTDLWHALNEPRKQDDLRWNKRCALACYLPGACSPVCVHPLCKSATNLHLWRLIGVL